MSNDIYTETNYRANLIRYWRQWFPNWTVPKGYHVHHIVPVSIAKQWGWSDRQINHPRNLIALHPDDHQSIHRCRGDKFSNNNFIIQLVGYKHSDKTKAKLKEKRKGKKPALGMKHTPEHRAVLLEYAIKHNEKQKGKPRKPSVVQKMRQNANNNTGFYITPWGKYRSIGNALDDCPVQITKNTLRNWCRHKNKNPLQVINQEIKHFGAVKGLTPNDLGFDYIPD